MRRGRVILTGALVVAALAFAVPALAQAPNATDQGYPCATAPPPAGSGSGQSGSGQSGSGGEQCTSAPPPISVSAGTHVQVQTHRTVTPSTGVAGASKTLARPATANTAAPLRKTGAAGTLPFTGAQLGIFAIVGLALIAGGLLLRASGRKDSSLRR